MILKPLRCLPSLLVLLLTVACSHAESLRVIVGFHGEANPGVFRQLGGAPTTELKAIGAVAGNIPSGKLRALRNSAGVAYVEEDLVRQANFEPDDTYYNATFSKRYENRGYNDQRDEFALINAQLAWDTTRGTGVRVAVLDTGVDLTHPDLAGQVVASRNFTNTGGSTDVTDTEGHGSHTAGTVAANTNNGIGVAGTAGDATLVIGKVLGPQGGYDSWVADGMLWAADPTGGNASIISMSLGGEGSSTALTEAANTVWVVGALSIAAAGNAGVDGGNHYPSADPKVMAIAAVDEMGAWADFSNYGDTLEVAAPGVLVLSTFNGGGYGWSSGTSMACPHVAGVAALIWSAHPTRDNAFVRSQLVAGGGLSVSAPDGGQVPIVDAAAALVASNPLPTVLITTPSPGATVSGMLTVTAEASSPNGAVTQVEFFVDGSSVGIDTAAPYNATWNSASVIDGDHTLSAEVLDVIGEMGADTIGVNIDNIDDFPSVAITSPGDLETVSGVVSITCDAADDLGLTGVEFFVDGASVGVDTQAPFEILWDSSGATEASHSIHAEAADTAGQTTASESISVNVDNTPSLLAVTSIDPDTISAGSSNPITVSGAGFEPGASVTTEGGSGPQPSFSNVTVIGSDTISATVTVKNGGPRRSRTWSLRVTNPSDGASAVLAGGLTVTP